MNLDFTNLQLYYLLDPIWSLLDYRFKCQINSLVIANDADSYVQTIDMDYSILYEFYNVMINSPINYMLDEIYDDLYPQLLAGSNLASPQIVDPNDYALGVILFDGYSSGYLTPDTDRTDNGKLQIIS